MFLPQTLLSGLFENARLLKVRATGKKRVFHKKYGYAKLGYIVFSNYCFAEPELESEKIHPDTGSLISVQIKLRNKFCLFSEFVFLTE